VFDGLLDLIGEDAVALSCEAECAHARAIVRHGSSADGQIAAFEAALTQGRSKRQALNDVVDWLTAETCSSSRRS